MVKSGTITLQTRGYSDVKDITSEVGRIAAGSSIKNGIVTIFAVGSTASISTIEYEPALVDDLKEHLENHLPSTMRSRHSQTWGDDNGFSHLRSTMMGPGITVPLSGGKLVLGTWQQIVLIDHDNRPRQRQVFVQLIGE
jgi:secondary thiamine-phosphate synthase enzyme